MSLTALVKGGLENAVICTGGLRGTPGASAMANKVVAMSGGSAVRVVDVGPAHFPTQMAIP